MYVDIVLCAFVYGIMLSFIIWHRRKNKPSDDGNDDDGGITVKKDPDLDLPPGVCLPTRGPAKRRDLPEEVLA